MLVIDVQGARQVRGRGIETVGIFVLPPSAAVLEQRLRGRSKDTEEQIRRRLEVARREVGEFAQYEYVVVNDELDGAVNRLRAIVLAERARVKAMRGEAETIIETFQVRGRADGSDRARRDRRHRRLQGGRGVPRAAEARPRRGGGDDAVGARGSSGRSRSRRSPGGRSSRRSGGRA